MMQTWTTDSSSLKIGAMLELMNHPFQLTLIQACCYTASKLDCNYQCIKKNSKQAAHTGEQLSPSQLQLGIQN